MKRARRLSPPSPSITHSVLRLARVTGHTALQNAQEVGGQLVRMAQQTWRGTETASVVIARDVADTARRTMAGLAGGLHELREEITRSRGSSRKPAAKVASRRRTAAQRRRRGSRGKVAAT